MSKKSFRIGQRVQVAADPSQTFTIRQSKQPERIYFGANRWWTKNELQALIGRGNLSFGARSRTRCNYIT